MEYIYSVIQVPSGVLVQQVDDKNNDLFLSLDHPAGGVDDGFWVREYATIFSTREYAKKRLKEHLNSQEWEEEDTHLINF